MALCKPLPATRPTPARRGTAGAAVVAVVAAVLAGCPAVNALEPEPGEQDAIKACEQRLCTMVLGKKPEGSDLKCDVAKTWDRDTLKKGESSTVSWGFGDARCSVDLKIGRADVVAALTKPSHVIEVPEHKVNCVVERDGKPEPVVARLAPKLVFKHGRADKIWINLADISGPKTITSTVWMAAELEDKIGIFHKSMLKSVNKFLYKRCGERYHADGTPKPDGKDRKKAVAKAGATKTGPAAATATKTAGEKPGVPAETGSAPARPQTAKPVAKTAAPQSADAK